MLGLSDLLVLWSHLILPPLICFFKLNFEEWGPCFQMVGYGIYDGFGYEVGVIGVHGLI